MGIYISGMEMPEDGCHHIICIYADGTVTTGRREYRAVPAPPHGRLIDADRMQESIRIQVGFLKLMGGELSDIAEMVEKGFLQEIANAPTIIPASGGNEAEEHTMDEFMYGQEGNPNDGSM